MKSVHAEGPAGHGAMPLAVCLLTVAACLGCGKKEPREVDVASKQARVDANGLPLPPTAIMRLGEPIVGGRVLAVDFLSDGNKVALARDDGALEVWSVGDGKKILGVDGHGDWGSYATFAMTRPLAAESFDGAIRLVDLTDGKVLHTIRVWEPDGWHKIIPLALSADGSILAYAAEARTIAVINTATASEVRRLHIDRGDQDITALTLSMDGERLAAGTGSGRTYVWETETGDLVRQLIPPLLLNYPALAPAVFFVEFSSDGRLLASCCRLLPIHIWSLDKKSDATQIEDCGPGAASLTFSPDGKLLAAGCQDSRIRFWDVSTREKLLEILVHEGVVSSVAFSADGKRFVSGSDDSTALVWDMSKLEALWKEEAGKPLVWELPGTSDRQREDGYYDDE